MKNRDTRRVGVLRLIKSALKQREIDSKSPLSDDDVISILSRMIKQRRESLSHYEKAKRSDLVSVEKFEISVLLGYMPEQISEKDIVERVLAMIESSGAKNISDMGAVMKLLKEELGDQADFSIVSKIVREKLSI
tara:strand:- start:146 stop:550 length:405 start_codon:yes stop_codon:yes gene_type:complete